MEGESTKNTKISDSAYSNSCSNSQSQLSGSSKSRHYGSNSSGSSGYGGKTTQANNDADQHSGLHALTKGRKKKRSKRQTTHQTTLSEPLTENASDNAVTSIGDTKGESEVIVTYDSNSENHLMKRDHSGDGLCNTYDSFPNCLPVPSPLAADHAASLGPSVGSLESIQSNREKEKPEKHTASVNNGFCCIISMHDGVILYTTNTITDALGFPRDMWLGRSFIDFVHPKDRATFASQITSGVAVPFSESKNAYSKDTRNSLFVLLRKYRGLKSSGFFVKQKSLSYVPFKLVLSFREAPGDPRSDTSNALTPKGTSVLLVMSAQPVVGVYKTPDEILNHRSPKFSTRHTSTGILTALDGDSVPAFGYLPQDVIGRSIMDFYHPADLPLLKTVYGAVMRKGETGAAFRSQPYRFLIRNGCYVTLETEWTSFVNPWSRKLEFVVGHHRVLKGPECVDIFVEHLTRFSEDTIAKSKVLKEEILQIMTETVSRPLDAVKEQISKRCIALASFMENLMDEVNRSDLQLDLPQELEATPSERDSVMMMGEISPHHDYYDSKSSSETPPSYNQLNYNENLQRFFNSRPTTTGSDNEMKMEPNVNEVGEPMTELSPLQRSGDGSGDSCSGGNGSSGSNNQMEVITNSSNTETGLSSDSFNPPTLTEALLIRHNDDMEKSMIKKHKDARNVNRKRSGSAAWDSDTNKHSKHQRLPDLHRSKMVKPLFAKEVRPDDEPQMKQSTNQNHELWRSFNLQLPAVNTTNQAPINTLAQTREIYPAVYFMPTQVSRGSGENSTLGIAPYYMTGLMYANHSVYNQPVFCPPAYQKPQLQPFTSSSVGLPEELVINTTASNTMKTSTNASGSDSEGSSFSSFCSSFVKTTISDNSSLESKKNLEDLVTDDSTNEQRRMMFAKRPTQMLAMTYSNEVKFLYQVDDEDDTQLLNEDMQFLTGVEQSDMVNAQLSQLYEELDQQGLTKLSLSDDERIDFFGEGNDGMPFSTMTMIYEENATFPVPVE
ncbi:period circadian protein-like isoform X2 [Bradysia coprophila]|uniref:period circadian protein-like isoform X2 n=1 Tax=Bradysia coprophila TaxID=38358 RepID=UPI00187D6F9D|nr:period circadian protein-like isoform X2 [Bradysia coprophila]